MAFDGLNELDNDRRCIGAVLWRETACGNPAASTWTAWRAECGVRPAYNKAKLTRYEAFLLYVRAHLREFCAVTKQEYPKTRNWGAIAAIADAYARHLKNTGGLDHLEQAALITDMDGRRVLEVARLFAGELRISESTVRRWLRNAGIYLKKGRIYSPRELREMALAIANPVRQATN